MACVKRCLKRNSSGLDRGYRESYSLGKRPKRGLSLSTSRQSASSTDSEVSRRKEKDITVEREASKSTRQRSYLECIAQEELKESYHQEPQQGLDDSQDSEESEEEVEGLTCEELMETEECKFFLKCVEEIAKNSTVNSTKNVPRFSESTPVYQEMC